MSSESHLSAEKLKSMIDYSPESGVLTWRVNKGGRAKKGYLAGHESKSPPYLQVRIDGSLYLGHRLAWLWMTGAWPENMIDHIDGNGLNNKWDNLRPATMSQNQHNRGKGKNNTSGYKGVWFHKQIGRWCADVWKDGKKVYLGTFPDKKAAAEAATHARESMHKEYCNNG